MEDPTFERERNTPFTRSSVSCSIHEAENSTRSNPPTQPTILMSYTTHIWHRGPLQLRYKVSDFKARGVEKANDGTEFNRYVILTTSPSTKHKCACSKCMDGPHCSSFAALAFNLASLDR